MRIKLTSEQELVEVSRELFHCMVNLRYWTGKWEQEHGHHNLAAKKKWERKADDLIVKYNLKKTQIKQEIKIRIDEPDLEQDK